MFGSKIGGVDAGYGNSCSASVGTSALRRSKRAILCIAGRGPLDEAAASILAQLLDKHGLHAEVVPHERVSRRGIESLDLNGVVMVCIAYLEVKGNPSHLRYLLQRLRERLPHGKLLVGLWPEQESVLSDQALQREIGADVYVSTLIQSVEACLAEARATERFAACCGFEHLGFALTLLSKSTAERIRSVLERFVKSVRAR